VAVGVIGHGGLGGGDRGDAVSDGGMIVDSAMDFRQAVFGTSAPPEILERLCLLDVRYAGFDGRLHAGQLVLHRDLAAEIGDIFALMEVLKFPVAGVVPIVRYGWSDNASMADDNSSAFNYRTIAGTDRLSRHAPGRAVDINPRENPAVYPDGRIAPAGAVYRPGSPGTFTDDHPVVCAFIERGWGWGGHFDHMRDYHHFEKPGHRTKENNRGSVPI
jgi:peptidoglycan L-alanyl-D-glutamate endopeptidase CwlK